MDHPNICRVYEFIEEDSSAYVVMEYIEGEDLTVYLRKNNPSVEQKYKIIKDIILGLMDAHKLGIVHRDIKPKNIMITNDGILKILDFGLSHMPTIPLGSGSGSGNHLLDFEDDTATVHIKNEEDYSTQNNGKNIFGTIAYMSPEQANGQTTSLESDIYSLGSLLFELFVDKRMFPGKGLGPLSAIRNNSLQEFPKIIPHQMHSMLKKMMDLNPQKKTTTIELLVWINELIKRPQKRKEQFRHWLTTGFITIAIISVTLWYFSIRPIAKVTSTNTAVVLPIFSTNGMNENFTWVKKGLRSFIETNLNDHPAIQINGSNKWEEDLVFKHPQELGSVLKDLLFQRTNADFIISPVMEADDESITLSYWMFGRNGVVRNGIIIGQNPIQLSRNLSTAILNDLFSEDIKKRFPKTISKNDMATMMYSIGYERYHESGWIEAMQYFKVALDQDPDFLLANIAYAMCLNMKGDLVESKNYLLEVIEKAEKKNLQKVKVFAINTLCESLIKQGDWKLAGDLLQQALYLSQQSEFGEWRK